MNGANPNHAATSKREKLSKNRGFKKLKLSTTQSKDSWTRPEGKPKDEAVALKHSEAFG